MLTLSGREVELINNGGVKISPRAIEDALLALPAVIDAAAFGVTDTSGFEHVWAAIVTNQPVEEAALDALRATLTAATAPETIFQVTEIPRNANGKIRREELVALASRMMADPNFET